MGYRKSFVQFQTVRRRRYYQVILLPYLMCKLFSMNIEASLFCSILEFHKINDDEILFASGDEQVVRGWHLQSDGEHQLLNKLVGQYDRIFNILFPPD